MSMYGSGINRNDPVRKNRPVERPQETGDNLAADLEKIKQDDTKYPLVTGDVRVKIANALNDLYKELCVKIDESKIDTQKKRGLKGDIKKEILDFYQGALISLQEKAKSGESLLEKDNMPSPATAPVGYSIFSHRTFEKEQRETVREKLKPAQ